MEKELLAKYRKQWDKWEVRGCILFSLLLQIFLIFSASFRKQKTKMAKFLRPIIWLAYLTADAVAMFSLGLLSDSIDPSKNNLIKSVSPTTSHSYNDLIAFWAPFLLLHLGGPDTITAFALEDNELWLRHMLWLCVEVTVAGYVFVIALDHNNSLLLPTLLMFVAGTIRYGERTWALYLASNDGFKGSITKAVDLRTNYAKIFHEYKVNKEDGLNTSILIQDEFPSVTLEIDSHFEDRDEKMAAFEFFKTFKCLISDLLLNFNVREQSRSFLLDRKPKEAFRIMDIELGFAYDILYTKAQVVHTRAGYITRAICFICVLVSFLFFWFLPKGGIHKSDVKITYALLGGAVVLDVVALTYLIFSDWTFVFLRNRPWLSCLRSLINEMATHRRRLQSKYVTQYNLINSRLFKYKYFKNRLEKLSEWWLIKNILVIFFYTSDTIVGDELRDFIFEEIKKKAKDATNLKESKDLSSCRGSWTLDQNGHSEKLKWTVDEVEFVESILLWHIATDLCYHEDSCEKKGNKKKDIEKNETEAEAVDNDRNEAEAEAVDNDRNEAQVGEVETRRQISKVISEYMVYLLVVHPSMISSIEGVRQIKFTDACEETMSIIKDKGLRDRDSARMSLLELSGEMPERTKMVLFDACYLVQILTSYMDLEEKWKTISEVWAELLAYAASHCRGNYHAKCLSTGGELLTYVWFLMAHLGLEQQYHVSSHASATVIVEK